MKLNSLSASAFAEKIGVQPSSISHVLSGRNKPSLEFVQKVLVQFPKVSADWLLTGNTKIKESNTKLPKEEKIIHTPTPQHSEKRIKKIVLFYTDNTFEEIIKND
jgi:transcriptional regulator with XRE-family HTH domain